MTSDVPEGLLARKWLSGAEMLKRAEAERLEKKGRTEEQIHRGMLEIQAIVEEVEHDPEVAQLAEEDQRKYGTLTPEEMQRRFTI